MPDQPLRFGSGFNPTQLWKALGPLGASVDFVPLEPRCVPHFNTIDFTMM